MSGFEALHRELLAWAEAAAAEGWIPPHDLQALREVERQSVESLFQRHATRPLIVALFGGTGVGKSSLLNRLAGEPIARVGVARPTSHEVTLYLHRDFQVERLPPELPLAETRIAYHHRDDRRLVAWLDMPDIDSTERHNRELVERWLPYVDWLVYVVSPERYSDDIGWRFVQRRRQRHAWLFVMNQWDQGSPEQLDDFRRRLEAEGFHKPVILRTACVEPRIEDDFELLEGTIRDAIRQYGLELLQALGVQARIRELQDHAARFDADLGDDDAWQAARADWQATARERLAELGELLNESATATALTVAAGGGKARALDPASLARKVWTQRHQLRWQDLLTELHNALLRHDLPGSPAEQALQALAPRGEERALAALEDALAAALARPGTPLQRRLYALTGWLSGLLPLAAAGWAVFHVVRTFWYGTLGEQHFLGVNFAIHAGLLIGLAWLVPWLLHRRLRPSLARSVARGLQGGIDAAQAQLQSTLDQAWQGLVERRDAQRAALRAIAERFAGTDQRALQQLSGFVARTPADAA